MAEEQQKQGEEFPLPRRSFTVEFWVGLFAIIGLACFSYLAINIAGMRFSDSGYYVVKAQFSNVAGLEVGAPVEIAGVQIGQVSDVTLDATEAVVTLQIKDGIQIRDDDIAQIRTKGIIGDKYVKISAGASDDILGAGDELSDTESAVEFEDILGKIIHSLDGGEDSGTPAEEEDKAAPGLENDEEELSDNDEAAKL